MKTTKQQRDDWRQQLVSHAECSCVVYISVEALRSLLDDLDVLERRLSDATIGYEEMREGLLQARKQVATAEVALLAWQKDVHENIVPKLTKERDAARDELAQLRSVEDAVREWRAISMKWVDDIDGGYAREMLDAILRGEGPNK